MKPSFIIDKISFTWDRDRTGEPKHHSIKMYIFVQDKSIVIENLVHSRSRPYNIYKRYVIPEVLDFINTTPEKIDLRGLSSFPSSLQSPLTNWYEILKDVKWSWNKNCGCSSCSCSPGFIGSEGMPLDIFVWIKAETEESKLTLQTL